MHAIYHDGSADYVSNLTPAIGDSVTVRLRVAAGDPVQRVVLRSVHDGEQAFAKLRRSPGEPWTWWEGQIAVTEPRIVYRFLVLTDEGQYFYNTQGLVEYEPLDLFDFKLLGGFQSPAWVKSSVFYQINPDTWRQARLDLDLKPDDYELFGHRPRLKAWGEPLQAGEPYAHSYYAGNLYGIAAGLDYLQDLGVNALYLNPIFKACTTHRYDTVDYRQVDPALGGNQALAELSTALHGRDMRYILDVVPNHCGLLHPWFRQAQADPESAEYGFFVFTHHPDQYHAWLGSRILVKLNYADPELRRRMYAGDDAVLRFWLRPPYQADGWRVDVGNMLGRDGAVQMNHEVLRDMRAAVKAECPECYFMGENFFDATDQLQGDMWDGVMNYRGFYTPMVDWLTRFKRRAMHFRDPVVGPAALSTAALVQTWRERLGAVPWAVNLQQFNLLGSHDTERVTTTLGDNERLYWLAVQYQMTFPGVPCIYYGNEVGQKNPSEAPAARAGARTCMDWDSAHWDMDSVRRYQDLIRLRRTHPALIDGGFQVLQVGQDGFIYQRQRGDEGVLFTANRAAEVWHPAPVDAVAAGWRDGTHFREFGGSRALRVVKGRLDLPPLEQGGAIWLTV